MAPRRLVVALLFLAVCTTCTTTRGVHLSTGPDRSVLHIPRAGESKPVEMVEEEFTQAFAREVRRKRPSLNPEKAARELFEVPPRSGWYRYTQREGVVPLDAPSSASQWAQVDARVTEVFERLRRAMQDCGSVQSCQKALKAELRELARELVTDGSYLNELVTRSG